MRADERGLTLVEVIIAALILGITAVGLFGAFDTSRRLSITASYDTEALSRAQEILERQRGVPYDDLTCRSRTPLVPGDPLLGPGAEYCIAVGDESTGAGWVCKTVTVSVYYTVPMGSMANTLSKQIDLTMERSRLD